MSASSSSTATDLSNLRGTQLREQVCLWLSKHVSPTKNQNRAPKGLFERCAAIFPQYKANGIRRLWRQHKQAILYPERYPLNAERRKGQGAKPKYSLEEVQSKVKAVPFRHRRSLRSLERETGITKSTLQRMLKREASLNQMTKQRIYFVRYGLTKYPLVEDEGPYDSPLHPIDGYEQGIAIARRLAAMDTPPDIVYCSSLHRAVSTSQLIVHALGKTKNSIRVEDGLIEWLTPSLTVEPDGTRLQPRTVQQLVDMTFTEIDQGYTSLNPVAEDPNNVPEGAPFFFESEEYLMTRAKTSMQRIIEHANGETICIVSHTPCAQAMALYLEGAASLDESKIGPWPLGGVTMFTKDSGDGWKLDMYADTSHMPGEYKKGLKEWSLPCLTKK
mmetsp:Transcript_36306/g.87610  ORF Transcript_36306/g.87610 Transcript_36306/m.87610 type:complete len:388 (-) Transcript_36306:1030-2193(-)